jgi:hypothetical protein
MSLKSATLFTYSKRTFSGRGWRRWIGQRRQDWGGERDETKRTGEGSTTRSHLSGLLLTDVGDSSVRSEAEALPPCSCLPASVPGHPFAMRGNAQERMSRVWHAADIGLSCLLTAHCQGAFGHYRESTRMFMCMHEAHRQVDGERKSGRTRGSERESDTITLHAAQPAPAVS